MADSHPDSTTTPSSGNVPNTSLFQKLLLHLSKRVRKTAHSTDRNLLRLSALLSTPSGIDAALCTTGYTLTLIYVLGQRHLEQRLATVASDLAAKASSVLLPGETLVASLPASASTKLLAQTVGSSKALAGLIADYRIFVRLWGVVDLYAWARDTWRSPLAGDANRKERLVRGTTWGAIATCVLFQVLENGAYLASKGVLTGEAWAGEAGKRRETWWWVWSCRFWAAYVGCELVRLGIERAYREERLEMVGDGEKEDKMMVEQEKRIARQRNFTWWKELISNLAYAPMTLHWSVEEGLLSELQVGIFGTIAGSARLVDAWRKTA